MSKQMNCIRTQCPWKYIGTEAVVEKFFKRDDLRNLARFN